MENFTYCTPTKLVFGKGVVDKLAEELAPFGKRVLLTYGGGSIKSIGLYDEVLRQLDGFEVVELSGIEPNPTTDQEVHHFTYAIYPHAEKWQEAGTVPQAFFLNQPALAVQGGKPGESFSLAGLDAPNVVLETIKRAEDGDGAIVRMYECENSLTNVTLDWNLPFHAAESCNCLEQPDGEPVEVKDGKITFTVKPYEIKTIRIR